MEIAVTGAVGSYVYAQIPAANLRNLADGMMPALAKNSAADHLSGGWHRYAGGHDLLLDVPATAAGDGAMSALRQAGHILLTDMPTKQGIPLPGLSQAGLGNLLTDFGIPKAWLSVSIFDGTVGILAISEGADDLLRAAQGAESLSSGFLLDTFGEGFAEIALAWAYESAHLPLVSKGLVPLLLLAGAENLLAGLVTAYQEVSVYVDPIDFFGAGLTGLVLGTGIGYLCASDPKFRDRAKYGLKAGTRSGVLGAMFAVETAFGFGGILGLAANQFGRAMAARHSEQTKRLLKTTNAASERFLATLCEIDPGFVDFLQQCTPSCLNASVPRLDETQSQLASDIPRLHAPLQTLKTEIMALDTAVATLDAKPAILTPVVECC